MSAQMSDMRSQLEENDQAKLLMAGLRGQNINDDDNAVEGLEMRLVEVRKGDGTDVLPTSYDPEKLREYFGKRPGAVLQRTAQLLRCSGGFLARLSLDAITGKLEENDVARASELRDTIASLGPFFIKLGQALSIRPDILSPRAMVELQRLCDKVPSFDSGVAMRMVEEEYGCPPEEIFSELTAEPVAAASLGQVYKGTLRSTGEIVALKVQRPFVLETVSLDLHLMRSIGLFLRKSKFLAERTDLVGILDEFAARFFEELDYKLECSNGIRIREDMKGIPNIVVPRNYPEFTTRRVFVTEWLEGEKLSQSTADDVQDLVNVGVVAYLTQLLSTGFFHADPHPGNLIRTPEGKLALLDFGLMTTITDDQKYGMIEAISHLVHRDYSAIGADFVKLDFIPRGIDITPIVPALGRVFEQGLAGGGAKSINFQELAADLAQITFEYPFRIPPYFALIIRAIGVLEGIALVGNPGFAIVDEAYPFISKKLLTDESPRLRAALRYMVYGRDGSFDVERMLELLEAFQAFDKVKNADVALAQLAQLAESDPSGDQPRTKVTQTQTQQALTFFFSDDGAMVREFLLDEVVASVDALGRDALWRLGEVVSSAALQVPGGVPFLRAPRIPGLLRAVIPPASQTDKITVQNAQRLLTFFGVGGTNQPGMGPSSGLSAQALGVTQERLAELTPVLQKFAPQMRAFGLKVLGRLADGTAARALRYTNDAIFGAQSEYSPPKSAKQTFYRN
jgi:aarF domain-containing kinase